MMENSQLENVKPSQNPSFSFPPHRRRPLQSNTYRVFVQIMSHCNALQSIRQHNKQGEAAEENKLVEVDRLGEVAGRNELLDHDPMEVERSLVQQKISANVTKEAIVFGVEDGTCKTVEGDFLNPMDIITDDKNGNRVDSFMEDNQAIDGIVDPTNGQKDGCNVGGTTEVSLTRQEEVDKHTFLNEVPEDVNSSLKMDMVAEFSRPIEHDNKNSTEEKTLSEGIEHELQLKEKELEKLIYASSAMNTPICGDIEEGEILGDVEVHGQAMDYLFDKAVSLEEKAEEARIHRDIIDKEEIACDGGESDLGTYGMSSFACLSFVDSGKDIMLERQNNTRDPDPYAETLAGRGDIEIKMVNENGPILETGPIKDQASGVRGTDHQSASAKDLASCPRVNSEGRTENKDLATNEKDNKVEKKKRKRGHLTKDQKEKKKKKERIKRAEKNRKLGVKRLKLQPVLKPKTVAYCRHYLKGRCKEGEKCKFSHDTIPLTKSQPCCHFARHSCLKGDDCPFDHQLSKYPCNNYVATGYCSRGADCLFSHKMAEEGDYLVTSNVPKPESESPFQTSDPKSKKQVKIHNKPPQSSDKSTEKKVAQLLHRPATQVPKGISVFSPLRSTPCNTSKHMGKHDQAAEHLKGDNGAKFGPKMTSSSSDSGQRSNGIMKRTPMRTPKGINFLSFGKVNLLDSRNKKIHGISESFLCDQSTSSRSPPKNGGAQTENPGGQSLSEPVSKETKVENSTLSAARPQGIKFLSFAEDPGDNSSAVGPAGLLPCKENFGLPLVHEREKALDRLKFSNEMPCGSAFSSNPFCQSSHQTGPRNAVGVSSPQKRSLLSNTPSSVQKALLSTLAFAAKFDSNIKLDQQIGTPLITAGNQPAK